MRSICGQLLLCSLRAHQRSSDQMKILKDQSAQTTTRVVGVAYRLWLPFSINRVLNLTKLRSVICMSVIYIYISIIYIYVYVLYIYRLDISKLAECYKLNASIWTQVQASKFHNWIFYGVHQFIFHFLFSCFLSSTWMCQKKPD